MDNYENTTPAAESTPAAPESSPRSRILLSVYVVIIFFLFAVPGLLTLFMRSSGSGPQRPSLIVATESKNELNLEFPSEFDDYFSSNFGLRSQFVTADAKLHDALLHHSSNDQVLVGKEDWLYFTETTDDYTGESAMDDRDIFRMARTIELMNEYTRQYGITMVFFAAPNKNSVYPEFMPGTVLASKEKSNLDRLSERLRGCNAYIDMKSAMLDYKENCTVDIYHKEDSHWNNLGALRGFDMIQANLNSRIAGFDYISYEDELQVEETVWSGDLAYMLFPTSAPSDVQYDLGIAKRYSSEKPMTDNMATEISTVCSGRYYSAICYRDSFFNALIHPVANAFYRTRFTRTLPYDLNASVEGEYNVAIIELVERNLYLLLQNAPVASAPRREMPQLSSETIAAKQLCTIKNHEDKVVINGTLGSWADVQEEDLVFIELRGETGRYFFEAFPIAEDSPYEDNGFSAIISKLALPDDTYSAYVHYGNTQRTTCARLDVLAEDEQTAE
ncbi:MAG: hypothetical protein E7559_02050 [Ruminococcaceae bacterium]|nr:hypothetical protein [Oscillospiraceae bacterium]